LGSILNGSVNLSGSLVDTWVYDNDSNPVMETFGENQATNADPYYIDYDSIVAFPFGYGLVEIIFVTNMAQYAIRGYKVRALDYIVKPVEYMSFKESLKRGIRNVDNSRDKYLTINFKEGVRKINIADIVWIESHGHRLTFHTKEAPYETTTYSIFRH
jgi:DNA-binding LytR/AlgR family response regulator